MNTNRVQQVPLFLFMMNKQQLYQSTQLHHQHTFLFYRNNLNLLSLCDYLHCKSLHAHIHMSCAFISWFFSFQNWVMPELLFYRNKMTSAYVFEQFSLRLKNPWPMCMTLHSLRVFRAEHVSMQTYPAVSFTYVLGIMNCKIPKLFMWHNYKTWILIASVVWNGVLMEEGCT